MLKDRRPLERDSRALASAAKVIEGQGLKLVELEAKRGELRAELGESEREARLQRVIEDLRSVVEDLQRREIDLGELEVALRRALAEACGREQGLADRVDALERMLRDNDVAAAKRQAERDEEHAKRFPYRPLDAHVFAAELRARAIRAAEEKRRRGGSL